MIAVIDYGVGNLFSLCRSLEAIGQQPVVTGDPALLRQADSGFVRGMAREIRVGDLRIGLRDPDLDRGGIGGVAHGIHRHIREAVLSRLVFVGRVDKLAAPILR